MLATILAIALIAGPASALDEVSDRVAAVRRAGQTPVALFDLDDTLVWTVERSRAVTLERLKGRVPAEIYAAVEALPAREHEYAVGDTFRKLCERASAPVCVSEAIAAEVGGAGWLERFLSSAYLPLDRQIACAATYVTKLERAGAKIVYLTGRPEAAMQSGTLESLRNLGFPVPPRGARLAMRKGDGDDLAFKLEALCRLRSLGTVVAVFENEPSNIDALHAAFPSAVAVFLETRHKPGAPEVWPGIRRVRDYCGAESAGDPVDAVR